MKKLLATLLVLTTLFAFAACAKQTPEATKASADTQKFTVVVVHQDKSEKTFTYELATGMLGEYLENEGLIIGSGDGMFHTVDGEKADWNVNQSYWAFYVDGQYALKGIYDTPIEGGKAYKLEYTLG